jgi:hypothetical protein
MGGGRTVLELWAGAAALAVAELDAGAVRWRPLVWGVMGVVWLAGGYWVPGLALCALAALPLLSRRKTDPVEREALARFWQSVALLTASGMTLGEAVETAAPDGTLGAHLIELIAGLMEGDMAAGDRFRAVYRSPEARETAEALADCWSRGWDVEAIRQLGRTMVSRLREEVRRRQAQSPLFVSVLPALMLLNLLLVFFIPLGISLWGGLRHL